jgi:hypothetical protein
MPSLEKAMLVQFLNPAAVCAVQLPPESVDV